MKGVECGLHKIILASKSPRRRELLTQMGLVFSVQTAHVEENLLTQDCRQAVKELAIRKAAPVAKQLDKGLVIGADTIVVIEDEILGKPKSVQDAERMLKKLSGNQHRVLTGLAVIDAGTEMIRATWEETKVNFRILGEENIKNYIKTGEYHDKAGGYGIQGKGALLVSGIEGCYFNVVGLPITRLAMILEDFHIKVL